VAFGGVRLAPAPAGDGVDGELRLEQRPLTSSQFVRWSLKPPWTSTRGGPLPYRSYETVTPADEGMRSMSATDRS
jgi:hypothetical protein